MRDGWGGEGWMDGQTHIFPVRVYYEDTDASGVVYHAAYLRFAERGRTEMMRVLGAEHARLWQESGIAFTVRRCSLSFDKPARLDDRLHVHTQILEIRGARMTLSQVIMRGVVSLVSIDLLLACFDRAGRAVRLPEAIRRPLLTARGMAQETGPPGTRDLRDV